MSKQIKLKDDEYNKAFPSRLRVALEFEGKSQAGLSKYLGITSQMVGYYKIGKSSPDWETIVKIAKYFNVSTDWLLGISDFKTVSADIQNAINVTGLSESAIETLCYDKLPSHNKKSLKSFLSEFLSDTESVTFFSSNLAYIDSYIKEASNDPTKEISIPFKFNDIFGNPLEDYHLCDICFELAYLRAREAGDDVYRFLTDNIEDIFTDIYTSSDTQK